MIVSFLLDSRYGGPQMINEHINKKILKKHKTIFLDKKNKLFKFINLKKKFKILYLVDIIFNLFILIIKKEKFFRYQTFFVLSIVNIVPVMFGILLKKTLVWYILEEPNTLFTFFFKILNKYSNIKILCISNSLGKKLKIKKFNVYFPSINLRFWRKFKRTRIQNEVLQITCVGNINTTKNHHQLIDFLADSKKKFNLNIVGKSLISQKEYFKKLNLKIKYINKTTPNKIQIFQNKKNKFIKKILNRADLYILPSISEGLSISLIEAMSMERICLVSKNSNHSKIIKNTQNGFEFELNKKSFLKIFNQSLSINKFKKNLITKKARYTVKKLLNNNKKIENKLKVSFFQSLN